MQIRKELVEIRDALKFIMKKQGLNQIKLAKAMGISLPTIRRYFSKSDLSFERLLEICDHLDLTINELFDLIKKRKQNSPTYYSEEQEKFLAKNFRLLDLLGLLYDGKSVKEISETFDISKKQLSSYLNNLENRNFILQQENKIKMIPDKQPKWRPEGPLQKYHSKIMYNGFSTFFKDRLESDSLKTPEAKFGVLSLTKKTYDKYLKEIEKLSNNIINESTLERKTTEESELGKFVYLKCFYWAENSKRNNRNIREILSGFETLG